MSRMRTFSIIPRSELSSSFVFLQGKAPKETHAILKETLAYFIPSWSKDLPAPQVYIALLYEVWDATDLVTVLP